MRVINFLEADKVVGGVGPGGVVQCYCTYIGPGRESVKNPVLFPGVTSCDWCEWTCNAAIVYEYHSCKS